MTTTEKVDNIYNEFVQHFDGSFHNTLWQIIVNNSLENMSAAFISDPVQKRVVIAFEEGGYIPANVVFKNQTLERNERDEILGRLNELVFGITPARAMEIELKSYRKPMVKAKPRKDDYINKDGTLKDQTPESDTGTFVLPATGEDDLPPNDPDDPMTNGSYYTDYYNRRWPHGTLGSFDQNLFNLFEIADGDNRLRLIRAFPEKFLPKE